MNIILKVLPRIAKALWHWPSTKSRIENPRVIMTLLVKNEEDKLEANLLFHHAMGVDGFIVTDNHSTDGTMAILQRYRELGWILEIIEEPSTGYEQKKWVDRMVMQAIGKYGANWIINADADELWYAPSGSLKTELSRCDKRIMKCRACGMYPQEDAPFYEWRKRVAAIESPAKYALSRYSIFQPQRGKVAHRADGYLHIAMGNHKVSMLPWTKESSNGIIIYHYSVGTWNTFEQKTVQGGRELEKHPTKKHARHWRYFYDLYKNDLLREEYDRVIGTANYKRLVSEGYIVEDDTIYNYFRNHIQWP
ncbi:MAG: glycosyltransferase family 2 protein [Bacteroidaceae bacterium]|nr:glycosyltransferase family 2 protein [Bacteroidaceae bacterium]